MARYFLQFRHSDTGLTLSFSFFKKASDLSAVTPEPTLYEVGNGTYYFDYTPTFDIVYEVDGSATITEEEIRYISGTVSPKDAYLDQAISAARISIKGGDPGIDINEIYNQTSSSNIADAVWDTPTSGHLLVGSTGEKLNALDTDAVDIATAVWDAAMGDHLVAGSTGEALNTTNKGTVSFLSNGDTVSPTIIQVSSPNHTQVKVTFSEPVEMTTGTHGALNLDNYDIPGLTIVSISALTAQQVLITTSTQTPNQLYTLDITNVKDLVGNVIV
jgi:hypothetical protein